MLTAKELIELLLSNNAKISILVIILIAFIFHFKKIIEFFDERNNLKIKKINEALACWVLPPITRLHLEKELVAQHFRLARGIYLEEAFREALINAHQELQGDLVFAHFKRALPHIRHKAGALSVELTRWDKFIYGFCLTFGILMPLSGLFEFTYALVFATYLPHALILEVLSLGCIVIVVGIILLFQTFEVSSAKKVQIGLKRLEEKRK
jgi:hypothetical protein